MPPPPLPMPPSRPSIFLPIAALTVAAFLLGAAFGGGGVYLAMHDTDSAADVGHGSLRRPSAQMPTYDGPKVAPLANPADHQAGITQSPQGNVYVRSGRSSITAMPRPDGTWLLAFGMRAAPGDTKREAMMTLINKEPQKRLGLTQEQQDRLEAVGPIPKPAEAVQQEIRTLFNAYVTASDGDKPAAQKQLLEAAERDGERRGPIVDQWIDQRMAVLTPDQLNRLVSRRGPTSKSSQ